MGPEGYKVTVTDLATEEVIGEMVVGAISTDNSLEPSTIAAAYNGPRVDLGMVDPTTGRVPAAGEVLAALVEERRGKE